jgi:hypothetical protein
MRTNRMNRTRTHNPILGPNDAALQREWGPVLYAFFATKVEQIQIRVPRTFFPRRAERMYGSHRPSRRPDDG